MKTIWPGSSARAHVRSKYLRSIERAGHQRERHGKAQAAIELYLRNLELEPLTETIYRRLMLCYAQEAPKADAIDAYRRCEHMLSVVLGVKPSADTDALCASLTRAGASPN